MMSAIIDSMHDGLTVIDERGQVLVRNPAGAAMVRTEPDRLNDTATPGYVMTDTTGASCATTSYPGSGPSPARTWSTRTSCSSSTTVRRAARSSVSARRLPASDARGMRPGGA